MVLQIHSIFLKIPGKSHSKIDRGKMREINHILFISALVQYIYEWYRRKDTLGMLEHLLMNRYMIKDRFGLTEDISHITK